MPHAAAAWDALLEFQASRVTGALGEIGVYRGKSAALLALHTRKEEHLYLVDICDPEEPMRVVARVVPRSQVSFLVGRSSSLPALSARIHHLRRFRWIHIDGEHTGEALVNDLQLAAFALHDEGVICIDDFFNPMYPQLTAATFEFVASHRHEVCMFLCGHNKGYLCRPVAASRYLDFVGSNLVRELGARGIRDVTLFKTTSASDLNCFGIGPRWANRDFHGPDGSPDVLPR